MSDTQSSKVVHRIQIGRVTAKIWVKRTDAKEIEHTVELERYALGEPIGPRARGWLGRDDLLVAARALKLAHAYICRVEGERNANAD